jgi:hypothetical protein
VDACQMCPGCCTGTTRTELRIRRRGNWFGSKQTGTLDGLRMRGQVVVKVREARGRSVRFCSVGVTVTRCWRRIKERMPLVCMDGVDKVPNNGG